MSDLARIRVTTQPTEEPVTVDEAKAHMAVCGDDDNTLVGNLIKAARIQSEKLQGRAYCTQTQTLTRDDWPCSRELAIPRPPLRSVTSVKYTPRGGEQQTLSSSAYVTDTASEPGRIVLKEGYDWPSDELQEVNGVVVEYSAGYGAAADVPETTKHAIKFLAAHWYEHRESVDAPTGNYMKETPQGYDALIDQDRIWGVV